MIRQHADNRGGWHTEPADIEEIVGTALEIGVEARAANQGEASE